MDPVRPRHAPVPHRARRLLSRRDPAAGGHARAGHPCAPRPGVRAARRQRRAAGASRPGAPHTDQQGVHAGRAVRARPVDAEMGRVRDHPRRWLAVRGPDPVSERAPILEMLGIRKAFPGVVALDGVDFSLQAGDVHMLLGENGAGKSTLMKILSGAYGKDAGEIRINGQPVAINSPGDALALGIRVIYQELNLVPQLSVAENIFLGTAPTRWGGVVDWRSLYDNTSRLLADLGMTLDPRSSVSRLGLAQRQMVEIAKALNNVGPLKTVGVGLQTDPSRDGLKGRPLHDGFRSPVEAGLQTGPTAAILVMDEPTSSLTSREVAQLFSLIERLASRGVAIVYITHRLDEVFRIGRRITVMRDGRHITTRPIADVTVPELVRLMANRDLTEHFPKTRVERGAELLRVERVSVAGKLSDISFSLHAGEVVGIAGLLGAGRTELARVIAGVDRCETGGLVV